MKDYPAKIEPEKFSFIQEAIDDEYPVEYPDWVKYSAVIFDRIASNMSYQKSGRSIFRATTLMDRLNGDCEDHSVLLASLFKAAGLKTRFLRLTKSDGSHIIVETAPPVKDTDLICDMLRTFYTKHLDQSIGYLRWETDDEGFHWFLADAVSADYIGDTGRLDSMGYLLDGTNGWRWSDCERLSC